MLLSAVREHVLQARQCEENVFGPALFDEHLVVVACCASRLAARYLTGTWTDVADVWVTYREPGSNCHNEQLP
jgi:DNA-binding transcriptional LysR family regulator